jgi:hypothetical protein
VSPLIVHRDGYVLGQGITFSAKRIDRAVREVSVTKSMRTVKQIASKKGGGVKNARAIADYNGIHSIVFKMKPGRKIRLPGLVASQTAISITVLAGDGSPTPTDGWAKWEVVDRFGRSGALQFTGYDPIVYKIPVTFVSTSRGAGGTPASVEDDIETLEQMAGRGVFPGVTLGPPAAVQISVTDNNNQGVPLIPARYQSGYPKSNNPNPPSWQITGIDYDESVPDGVLRNDYGNRIKQKATITVQQYTRAVVA